MMTYQMISKKNDVSVSTVKTVSGIMGISHRITTSQLHQVEKALKEIRETRDNLIYVFEIGREHAEEEALNEWFEEREMEKAGRQL